jgi:hypothetical protein
MGKMDLGRSGKRANWERAKWHWAKWGKKLGEMEMGEMALGEMGINQRIHGCNNSECFGHSFMQSTKHEVRMTSSTFT